MSRQNYSEHHFPAAGPQTQNKDKDSEENKQFDPDGEGGEQPPPWNAAVMVVFSFSEGSTGSGMPVVCALGSLPVCYVLYSLFLSGNHFSVS